MTHGRKVDTNNKTYIHQITKELACERFFWPKIAKDIEHYARNVCSCIRDRRPVITMHAPAQSFKTS